MDMLTAPAAALRPAAPPLGGVTILLVEDGHAASDALRLPCARLGARLLRAGSPGQARRHLRVYLPGCVIVDLGLPGGSGAGLLSDLAQARPRIDVLLGISADPWAESLALAAGADGFLTRPLASPALLQRAVCGRRGTGRMLRGGRACSA